MKNTKNIIFITFIFLGVSCTNLFLEKDIKNTPENNFEVLWQEFDQHYALFKNIDWDSVYSEYRPKVNANTSDEELWDICTEMLAILNDGHTRLYDRKQFSPPGTPSVIFRSGLGAEQQEADSLFSISTIIDNYLDSNYSIIGDEAAEEGFLYGKIGSTGYIYIPSFDGNNSTVSPAKWANQINQLMNSFSAITGVVIDIRDNTGGYDINAKRVAGAFASECMLAYTVQTRNGPGKSDFDSPNPHFVKPIGEIYTGPIIFRNICTIDEAGKDSYPYR